MAAACFQIVSPSGIRSFATRSRNLSLSSGLSQIYEAKRVLWFVIIISSVANTAYESKGKREAAASKQLPVAPTWHRSGSEH